MCENCPYCLTWGGREEGLQPLAYTEKTLFWIWPLEFVRHILEVHLHQTGSGTNFHRPFGPHKRRWCLPRTAHCCLTSTRSSPIHLKTSWSLTRSGRSFISERERAPQHSHVQNALGLKAESPLCLQTCFGRRLSIHLYKKTFFVQVPSLLPDTRVWSPPWERLASNVCLPEMNGLDALLLLWRAAVLSEVNKLEWKWESELLIHCLIVKCVHHATTWYQSYKSGPLQPGGYSSQMAESFS